MHASNGGVTMSYIDDLTFPELVELWREAINFKANT
jgi:hypothetical protein